MLYVIICTIKSHSIEYDEVCNLQQAYFEKTVMPGHAYGA